MVSTGIVARLALIIEYDGARYSGFQYQENAPSIQAALEAAAGRLTGEAVRIAGAGRTDAGVHAEGQVVAFDCASALSPGRVASGMNHHLPGDIVVRSVHGVPDEFDPRRDAVSRWYRYSLLRRRHRSPLSDRTAVVVGRELDLGGMRRAAWLMVGVHDFAGLAGLLDDPAASTVREVSRLDIRTEGERISIDVEGNAFLPHQVRRMVGVIVDAGTGKIASPQVEDLLSGEGEAPPARSMPPQGLCLMRVRYPEELGISIPMDAATE